MTDFKSGDRVRWLYKTRRFGRLVRKEKNGGFQGYEKDRYTDFVDPEYQRLAFVLFDGNVNLSRVPVRDLSLIRE